jgi:hypothetical protein
MGRSVSTPHNATVVAYSWVEAEGDDEYASGDAFDSMVEGLQEYAPTLWPSLRKCAENTWLGREDHALLENDLCYMGISEYCGCVAFWIVPKDDDEIVSLAERWVSQIEPKFLKTWGRMTSIGRASNGEQFFQKVAS